MRRAENRPNVVIFFTDQQRWDSTGVHGCPLELTPNFDRMAVEGTHCYHAFTCQPVCMPARAALQTGRYPTQVGCPTNGGCLPPDVKTLGHWFREGGYHTGYIGKWHLYWAKQSSGPVPPEYRSGYDEWLASNLLEFTSDAYDTVLFDHEGKPVKLPGYRVDAIADAGIRFIERNQHRPFFLMMSFLEPHHQNHRDEYAAPEGYRERYAGRWTPPDLASLEGSAAHQLGGYWGCIKRLDEALGRVRDALRSLGLHHNTIVVFTSDHGCHFKTRNDEYKRSCHESSIRIPMALCGPGFDGGGQRRELISLIDLPPTLLEAAGLPVPTEMQGKSFWPCITRRGSFDQSEVFFQISEAVCGRGIRTHRWKYAVHAPNVNAWVQPHAEVYEEQFLYDLLADPYELQNLIEVPALEEVRAELRHRLIHRIREAEGVEVQIKPATSKPSGQLYDRMRRADALEYP
ncbi:MAG: sulfatase-like hydrolase/transferase [Verrucomicrobiae bacterium]|nr:sulfatase-like hydrolase/transferase [Verrucomicrobiae bacterium]